MQNEIEKVKQHKFTPELLEKCGVILKVKNGKHYYKAFEGKVTWVEAPDAAKVFFRYTDE